MFSKKVSLYAKRVDLEDSLSCFVFCGVAAATPQKTPKCLPSNSAYPSAFSPSFPSRILYHLSAGVMVWSS